MENHKIRIAITQGDSNGIGYELIFKIFSELEMFEICTPIVYGSSKIAGYQSNVLQSQCQYKTIKDARDAQDGHMNLLSCIDEGTHVDFGKETIEGNTAAIKALEKALADTKEGLCDIIVCGAMSMGELQTNDNTFPGMVKFVENASGMKSQILPIYLNELIRIAVCEITQNTDENLTQELLVEKVKSLHTSMKRDFRLSNPRIAILSENQEAEAGEQEVITNAVSELKASGIQVFGSYQAESFIEERKYEAFDAILAVNPEQAKSMLKATSDSEAVIAFANCPITYTMVDTDARYDIAGKNLADEAGLRNAIYTAIDICRHRKEYDKPMANPLPKLYHERPDNGEKLRFSIPKKQEEA